MIDPANIVYHSSGSLPEGKKAFANTVLTDFTEALQFLANWMSRIKALS
jgi:hypothetical protein